VLPVDRETGRPRGFAFIEFAERSDAEQAIQRFNGQVFNGRPLAVSEARAREDRGPGGPGPRPGGFGGPRPGGYSGPPRPGGFSGGAPRPGGGYGGPRPFDPGAPPPPRGARNFGPDAKPQRGQNAKAKKKESERPRGPIPLKNTGRSFSLDDDSPDEVMPDMDDFATSRPSDDTEGNDE
jgi:RNA recognition motif-containing protein